MHFRKNELVKILFFITSVFIFISCGGWSTKEKSEFIHDCKGDKLDDATIEKCKCVYKAISQEFTYQESQDMGLTDLGDFNDKSQPKDSRLEAITPSIKECYKNKEAK